MTLYPAFSSLSLRLRPSLFHLSIDFVGIEIPMVAPLSKASELPEPLAPRDDEQAAIPNTIAEAAIATSIFFLIFMCLPQVVAIVYLSGCFVLLVSCSKLRCFERLCLACEFNNSTVS